jgi:hypothetical protein|tara:strand:- start:18 stop:326 length:309 start_codon:yes stop_codon:yes gene_type:complete
METQLTQEERIAIIRDAHEDFQTLTKKKAEERIGNINVRSIMHFVEEVRTEEFLSEHGTLDAQENDLKDESQFFLTDSAEEIDEEDEDFGLSEEMRRIYDKN